MINRTLIPAAALLIAVIIQAPVDAQRGAAPPVPVAPQTPVAAAPIDLTGYWVAIVNEEWRWRMVTPPKGDFASLPLNAEGTRVGNTWDAAQDGSCLAYGAAGLLRMPTRLHISWENDSTLKLETDAGTQTRRFVFDRSIAPGPSSLQGFSLAQWERSGGGRGAPGGGAVGAITAARSGNLKVTTTHLTGGWLRRNGAPYSDQATMTEYLRPFRRTQRRRVAGGDDGRVRPALPPDRLRHQQSLSPRGEWRTLGADAVQAGDVNRGDLT